MGSLGSDWIGIEIPTGRGILKGTVDVQSRKLLEEFLTVLIFAVIVMGNI